MVAATEAELTKAKVPYEVGVARYRKIAHGQAVGDDSGFSKMLFHRDEIGLGGGLHHFLSTVFNYPTLAACYKVAALNAANKLTRPVKARTTRATDNGDR